MKKTAYLMGLLFCFAVASCAPANAPTGLMCELMAHPEITVVRDAEPEFSWIMQSDARGDVQTAYRILVASDPDTLAQDRADVWDSGKVASDASVAVSYQGEPLKPGKTYYWKVKTWNRAGQAGAYAPPQRFTTADELGTYATSTYPLQQTPVAPTTIVKNGDGDFFIDFGKAAFGWLVLDLKDIPRESTLLIELGEKAADHRVDSKPGGTIRYAQTQLSVPQGSGRYRVPLQPDHRNTHGSAIRLPEAIGVIMPFRYVTIKQFPGDLDASMLSQVTVHYPFDETASRFTCSDATLNAVWDLCKYTQKVTSFCGIYVDGDRERIPYEADAYINQLLHYGVDHEYTMARYSHEYLMTHPTWPTEWILHSVLMAWADYMNTGDAESLRHWYDDLQHKTLTSLARDDGLISTQTGRMTDAVLKAIHINQKLRDIVDWPPAEFTINKQYGERDGYVMTDINTVVNAFHFQAVDYMSRIAEVLEKAEDAARYRQQAEKVKNAVNEKLFNPARGIYVDGEGTDHSALHANMMPLAMEMVPPERVPSVADFIKSRGMACSVYGAQYLLEALYHAGEDQAALDLMTARHDRSWWNMIAVGSTVALEAWDWKYKNNLDWNHAWGAAPGNIIPRYLLGVRPLEPGFRRVLIKPQPGSLTYAEGTVPTIRGPIDVTVRQTPGKSFELMVTVPANTLAEVHLPAAGPGAVTESGTPAARAKGVTFLRKEKDRLVYEIGSGTYTFVSTLK